MAVSGGEADRIRPVKENVEDDLIAREGIVAVDIGEKVSGGEPTGQPSIVVYVQKKKPVSSLSKAQRIPAEIDGVPTDVVEIDIELQTALVRVADDVELQLDPGSYRPLRGGISMGPDRSFWLEPPEAPAPGWYRSVGTLGAMVEDRATGARMAMTNFHVAAVNTGWSVGDVMVQPGHPDGSAAAPFGRLSRAVLSDNVDGSVVSIDTGVASECDVVDIGRITGSRAAAIGMSVHKRGRTTNLTHGTVGSVDVTVSIPYGDGLGTRTLRHQIRVDRPAGGPRFSDRGDSGSVVVDDDERVVGLLFAGATDGSVTFANPIAAVLNELGVNLCVTPVPPVTRAGLACPPLKTRLAVSCFELVTRVPRHCDIVRTRFTLDCFDLRTRIRILCVGPEIPDWPPRPPWENPRFRRPGEGPASKYGAEQDLEESFWTGYAAAYEEMHALGEDGDEDTGSGT